MSHWTVAQADAGSRLDKFLAAPARLTSRAKAADALAKRKVFVNDTEVDPAHAGERLREGDRVRVWMDRPGSSRRRAVPGLARPLDVVFEDDALIVLNKPAGLLTVPLERHSEAPSVYDQIEDHLRSRGKRKPLIVHRIDRDTSGLVVFAKHALAQGRLKAQFKRREPERVYLALVYGCPEPPSGVWRDTLVWDQDVLIQKATHPDDPRGKEAIAEYRVVERFADVSLVEVRLVTGKRNQIRLQARLRGHTLVGEQRYVYGPATLRPIDFPRQALHASALGFTHPMTDEPVRFEAPLPADMSALVTRLRRAKPKPQAVSRKP